MKTLLLIPGHDKSSLLADVAQNRQPAPDYLALSEALHREDNEPPLVLGYDDVERSAHPLVRAALRGAGHDFALAMLGMLRKGSYDAVFSYGEQVGIPFALLLHPARRRPAHVCLAHRISTEKKRAFFRWGRAQRNIDTLLVYAQSQRDFAIRRLGLRQGQVQVMHFFADAKFFAPATGVQVDPGRICSAGLEWRDYPTLISVAEQMSDLNVRIAAASPWSKHRNETEGGRLPPNVQARRYDYPGLRELYAESSFVVVPLYENDFQAGITTILEAMAMGKATIVSRTSGQKDVIENEQNGLIVPVGDADALGRAIRRLREDDALRTRLGTEARLWVERHATLDRWVETIVAALREAVRVREHLRAA